MNILRQTVNERGGILIILILSVFVLYIPTLIKNKIPVLDQERLAEINAAFARADSLSEMWKYIPIHINSIDADSLQSLGLHKWLSSRIIAYRDGAGGFREKDDLKNIFGLEDSVIQKMNLIFDGYTDKRDKYFDNKDYTFFKKEKQFTRKSRLRTIKQERIRINFVGADSLKWIGLPDYMAERIIKFRPIVKNYTKIDDLLRVYGIDTSLVEMMNINYTINPILNKWNNNNFPLDTINSANENKKKYPYDSSYTSSANYPEVYVDINTAKEEDLIKIYGIGPFFAKQILLHRDRLGGFYSMDQIKYTPKLHPDGFEALQDHILFDTPPKAITIDSTNISWLVNHPYFSKRQVDQLLLLYQNGRPSSAEVIKAKIFSDWEWERVHYYF